MKEVIKVKTRYKTFGMILGIGISELDAIQRTNVFDLEDALVAVVVTWLRQRYDVEKYGHPTWRRIVAAIDNEAGGNNHALAKRIANNHPGTRFWSSYVLIGCFIYQYITYTHSHFLLVALSHLN